MVNFFLFMGQIDVIWQNKYLYTYIYIYVLKRKIGKVDLL